MEDTGYRAIAIVGLGAILPDAPNVAAFWENIMNGRYSVSEVMPDRWNPADYYDPDPAAPDKSYSKIGGWVREFAWEPMKWKMPIPPKVADAMDVSQRWALACTREALEDYGYPKRALDVDRTAVILGNAMGGEKHYFTVLRVLFPEIAHELRAVAAFNSLPEELRDQITRQLHERMNKRLPEVTEDTMPGELSNCIAGRIANIFNFHGPNFTADAACASAMAAISSAVDGLAAKRFDVAVTGGIDRNMGASTFVKFCKIGALSATGTRPYAQGADGFVMGEGAAVFVMKRLEDAERDGDKVYAVLRGLGGSSDGRGKGITAPNPIGQKFAIERAWQNAGLSPDTVTLIEGHGTSTKVGDVVEIESMMNVLGNTDLPHHSVALGSVKSNFGHLKSSAGSAGLLKASLALHNKVLPPSLHCEHTNPGFDFVHSPLYVNTELNEWKQPEKFPRRAGLSAFGFGGTNFHAVLEEFVPGMIKFNGHKSVAMNVPAATPGGSGASAKEAVPASVVNAAPAVVETAAQAFSSTGNAGTEPTAKNANAPEVSVVDSAPTLKAPLRGALVIGARTAAELIERLKAVQTAAAAGQAPAPAPPKQSDLHAPERIAIDYGNAGELAEKATKALKALGNGQPAAWRPLRAQGIFRGRGPAAKVAFLYTGQGSQYVNMLRELRAKEPIVDEVFVEADRVMTPILGKPLSDFIYIDAEDPKAVAKAEEDLRQTAITQPAVLATDTAMTKLLAAYGIVPDFTMGHSLGEYGALISSGAMPFPDALEAVAARGREMTRVSMTDNGKMAAVIAPLEEIERTLKTVNGYVVIANINSDRQAVIGGSSKGVEEAMQKLQNAGHTVVPLVVSHAFHTSIVAPASGPLRSVLERLHLESPKIPIIANVDGEFYPTGPDVREQMLDILAKQVAAPVQFVKGLRTLYKAGARVFIETGPKKALQGFVDDVLGPNGDVISLFTNHPKFSDVFAFNQALCGLYASGQGAGVADKAVQEVTVTAQTEEQKPEPEKVELAEPVLAKHSEPTEEPQPVLANADVLPVAITGAALGLPGTDHVFDDGNLARILRGDQFIGSIPTELRQAMLDKNITRLVKSEQGGPVMETVRDLKDAIKLAGRGGKFDAETEFGIPAERNIALDRATRLAIGAGIDALRDAGIPLVMRYKTTTKGTLLPDRWGLPDALRDDTGIVFGSAFPGYDAFAGEIMRFEKDHARREQLKAFEVLLAQAEQMNAPAALRQDLDARIRNLKATIDKEPYNFDRRFLFRVLSMGHSQFAEYIGARGPNTQINAACASTGQALTIAEDWIRAGRCRRVIVISADDVTSDNLIQWIGAGFLASGAAATDEHVEDAAIPFDRRRHGLIVGMGGAALVVESAEAARERGIQPICELLSGLTANSAFHGTRLDVQHICGVMETLISKAEKQWGIDRKQIAPKTVFVSHETYTPARGGSAAAEIHALRRVFGDAADQIVIANTKGYTGHAMGTGIEEVLAVKALETGIVPPVANFKEIDPELGSLNLSKGGEYPVEYSLRLGAGFGSQISMGLFRWVKTKDGARRKPDQLGYAYRIVDKEAWKEWMARMTGTDAPELEVVNRTLRVRDTKMATLTAKVAPQQPVAPKVEVQPPIVAEKPIVVEAPPVEVKVAAAAAGAGSAVTTPTASSVPITPVPVFVPPMPVVTAAPELPRVEVKLPEPPKPAAPVVESAAVKERILALVSEKTGYPPEMLDVDLDLEADLGVDTVKQAEVFASVREAYGIPRDENMKLRDFPTLAHVIRFVYDKRPDLTATVSSAEPKVEATAPVVETGAPAVPEPIAVVAAVAVDEESIRETVLAIVAEKTGYPKEMLDLDLDLEADLGIDTVKQAEMFAAVRAAYDIPRDENMKLRDFPTLAHVTKFAQTRRPGAEAVAVATPPLKPTEGLNGPATPAVEVKQEPVAAAETPVSATVSATPAVEVISEESIKETVLGIVADKTGYPKEMLDLDLDLEADLGIDTVKQAEMFAAVRAAYNIPRDENMKLRDFPTLAHVIKFAQTRRPGAEAAPAVPQPEVRPAVVVKQEVATPAGTPAPATVSTTPIVETVNEESIKETVLVIVAEKTGYPKEMLDLDLDLEADLGIDTVKQAEMFAAVRAAYNIPRDENMKLRDFPTLAHVIKFAQTRRPGAEAAAPQVETPVTSPAPEPAPVAEPVTAPAVVAPEVDTEAIKETVLAIVAEKTGYPKEMLDLDLDLEADLGIDTVKQAEMFAAVRGAYNIPRDENMKLRDFPTLAHVIKFAVDRSAVATAPLEPKDGLNRTPTPVRPRPNVASFDAANSIPRRVPVPVLRPPLTMCKPTGVKLGAGTRVVLMPDHSGVAEVLTKRLQAAGVEVLRIDGAPDAEALTKLLTGWAAAGTIHGVYWLPALDYERDIARMEPESWREGLRVRVKSFFTTMRALYQQVSGPGTFLLSAVHLGGQHGYDEAGADSPMGGAVCGFTKTYKREKADVLVKAVDFGAKYQPEEIADLLVRETLHDTGAVEIGYKAGARWTVGLAEKPAVDGQPGMVLDEKSVFVVTGAAGSIVSAITADLAAVSGGTFYLLDLVPEPDPNNPDLKLFATDKEKLKRELFTRIQQRGERATPALVEKELAALERAQAAVAAIEAVRKAGGTVHYYSVNLTDAEAVANVMKQVRERSGRIDVLLHAAGMERSHFLPDKDPREFDLVFDVKANGFYNLLHGIGDMPLGATVCFSSIAGRFGNGGQTDYSSANDLLCKYTSSFRTTRPRTRGIAIDWTAWGGIGMATRGSIPKMMEMAGIDMLPPEAGVPYIRRELTMGGTRGEVVVGQRLGVMLNEFDPDGGLDRTTSDAVPAQGPMVGKIVRMGLFEGISVEVTIDPKQQAFLYDHQIDGIPVLPGVMGIEAFAEAVHCVLPGWNVRAVEEVNFQAPFKFYKKEPRTVTVELATHFEGEEIVADCRLIGHRQLPNQKEPQVTTHFTGRVRMARNAVEPVKRTAFSKPNAPSIKAEDVYHVYFHGPAYKVIQQAWREGNRIVGEMTGGLPGNHQPADKPLVMAPRLIELCFQVAGLWGIAERGELGLPLHVDRVAAFRSPEQAQGKLYAVVTVAEEEMAFNAEVVDEAGNRFIEMIGYRTVALPGTVNTEPFKAKAAA